LGEKHPDQRDMTVAAFSPHMVPRTAWAAWRELCWEKSLADCIHLWSKAAQKFDLERDARDRCLRIFAASQLWTDTRRALGDVIAYCLVPQTANQDGTVEDLCDGAQLPYRDMREARRLGGCPRKNLSGLSDHRCHARDIEVIMPSPLGHHSATATRGDPA